MGQVNVHDDKLRQKSTGLYKRVTPVTHRQRVMTMRAQQIAEKFQIEFVVLDNEHALCQQKLRKLIDPRDIPYPSRGST
ncbi:hypothetical protein Sbs19_10000 [Sphingobium sp. BS19]|nr:hypothetical protein Sbs19_10000 [Sphingobium sp. BS19]